jgi:hypothetical protein
MNFLVTIYVKRELIVVVRHYVCKPKVWLQNGKVLGTPFCPIYISSLILKIAKHIVMSMHVCVCCENKLILIVRVVIMLVAI